VTEHDRQLWRAILVLEQSESVEGFDYIGPAAVKPLRFSYWIGVEEALQAMGVQTLMIGEARRHAPSNDRSG
jgi:hypothetical protein